MRGSRLIRKLTELSWLIAVLVGYDLLVGIRTPDSGVAVLQMLGGFAIYAAGGFLLGRVWSHPLNVASIVRHSRVLRWSVELILLIAVVAAYLSLVEIPEPPGAWYTLHSIAVLVIYAVCSLILERVWPRPIRVTPAIDPNRVT